MMIEMTLLKINKLKYTDIELYAKSYDESTKNVTDAMDVKK